jgi:histidinol-phosphate aminotransferase
MSNLLRSRIFDLPAYNAGVSIDTVAQQFPDRPFAKLDSNEAPLPPSPGVIAALASAAASVARYPDRSPSILGEEIATRSGHPAEKIFFGNGSEDVLSVLYHTMLDRGDRVVTVSPSFGLYEFWASANGATMVKIPFRPDWRWPIDEIMSEAWRSPRVIILSAPSNPAGCTLTAPELERIVSAIQEDTLFILDEAYVEYIEPEQRVDTLRILRRCRGPWAVLRTFSKAYGLAGMRLGYAFLSRSDLHEAMGKVRCPFSVNRLAQVAALAAWRDELHLERVVALTRTERPRIEVVLATLGLPAVRSAANFVFFDTGGNALDFCLALRQDGIFIKPWLEEPFTRFARATVGAPEENDLLIAGLKKMPRRREPAAVPLKTRRRN